MSTEADAPPQDPQAEPPAGQAAPAESPAPADAQSEASAEPQAHAPEKPVAAAADEPLQAPAEPAADAAAGPAKAAVKSGKPKPRRKRPPRRPAAGKDLPRSRAVLPLDELRDASRATLELFGQQGIREAFLILAPRERQDISALIANEEDHRPRTRNIANGSLGAGRIDKAMSATMISMAKVEDLWAVTLDKERAAEKIGRIRAAKQRDRQKADRAKERANRADRVSREDMAKARDGSVGATIRIVTEEKRPRRDKGTPDAPPKRESVLDRLGY